VGVGPVGYEREVENTFSLMSVLDNPGFLLGSPGPDVLPAFPSDPAL